MSVVMVVQSVYVHLLLQFGIAIKHEKVTHKSITKMHTHTHTMRGCGRQNSRVTVYVMSGVYIYMYMYSAAN